VVPLVAVRPHDDPHRDQHRGDHRASHPVQAGQLRRLDDPHRHSDPHRWVVHLLRHEGRGRHARRAPDHRRGVRREAGRRVDEAGAHRVRRIARAARRARRGRSPHHARGAQHRSGVGDPHRRRQGEARVLRHGRDRARGQALPPPGARGVSAAHRGPDLHGRRGATGQALGEGDGQPDLRRGTDALARLRAAGVVLPPQRSREVVGALPEAQGESGRGARRVDRAQDRRPAAVQRLHRKPRRCLPDGRRRPAAARPDRHRGRPDLRGRSVQGCRLPRERLPALRDSAEQGGRRRAVVPGQPDRDGRGGERAGAPRAVPPDRARSAAVARGRGPAALRASRGRVAVRALHAPARDPAADSREGHRGARGDPRCGRREPGCAVRGDQGHRGRWQGRLRVSRDERA